MRLDRGGAAMGQAGIEAEAQVRRTDHLLDQLVDRLGQALPAPFRIVRQRAPAALAKLVVRLFEALRGADDAILPDAAFEIAARVERQQHLMGELGRLLDHRVDQVGGELLVPGEIAEAVIGEQLVDDEAHVAQRGLIDLHRSCS